MPAVGSRLTRPTSLKTTRMRQISPTLLTAVRPGVHNAAYSIKPFSSSSYMISGFDSGKRASLSEDKMGVSGLPSIYSVPLISDPRQSMARVFFQTGLLYLERVRPPRTCPIIAPELPTTSLWLRAFNCRQITMSRMTNFFRL
uniref:Uncharacterized protein n=1 Tax=Plectus sambesii TaxID=2011161 RepID=A0A914WP91_9BILA